MKVLFLYPNLHGMNMLPPAVGLLIALLRERGHQVALFDSTNWVMTGADDFDSDQAKAKNLNARPFDDSLLRSELRTGDVCADFRSAVEDFKPGLIAVSVSEDIFPVGIRLLEAVKDLRVPTIMGGVFPTFAPELCLAHDTVDMVCIGEGEGLLPELCARLAAGRSYDDLENLWLKKADGGTIKNPLAPPVDIDRNPLVDFSDFDESRLYRPMQGKVWRMLPVETHRGCPYTCGYCNSPSQDRMYREHTGKRYFRAKSTAALRAELQHYVRDYKAEAFYFWADTFLAYTDKQFGEFIEMYQDIRLPFWCQAFPETIREDRIRKLMGVGLFRVGTGIEHGNEEFRRKVLRRSARNAAIIENLRILNRCGLPFSVNNIIGFPTETRELAFDTIELNRQVQADSHNAYSFSPFHGTPLRELAEKLGYIAPGAIARSLTKATILDMPQFRPHEIEGLRRCFVLYVKMPKSRWPDIAQAEKLTPEGDRIWEQLRDECATRYLGLDSPAPKP
ncbi:MAG: radical SAM protein [Elusimicrobia bacterium]|nr:radical SAM protein [Elusimicrobiota bacterium]